MAIFLIIMTLFFSNILYAQSATDNAVIEPKVDVDEMLNSTMNPFKSKLPIPPAPVRKTTRINVTSSTPNPPLLTSSSQVMVKPQIEKPNVSIEGLVWSDTIQEVIMGGNVLGVGESLNGIKILKVTRSGVQVLYKGNKFTLNIP